jgi:hypothetical protein
MLNLYQLTHAHSGPSSSEPVSVVEQEVWNRQLASPADQVTNKRFTSGRIV